MSSTSTTSKKTWGKSEFDPDKTLTDLHKSEEFLQTSYGLQTGSRFLIDQNQRVIQGMEAPSDYMKARNERIKQDALDAETLYAQKYQSYIALSFSMEEANKRALEFAKLTHAKASEITDTLFPVQGSQVAIQNIVANSNLKTAGFTSKPVVNMGTGDPLKSAGK